MSGWVLFAALLFSVVGGFDIIWGLAAVLNDEVLTVGGAGVLILDFTVWGWVHIVLGAVMLATSLGLYAMKSWARTTAILLAVLNAFAQMAVITAFPLWAILVVALDMLVIYGLTARWDAR